MLMYRHHESTDRILYKFVRLPQVQPAVSKLITSHILSNKR
jgi:hypothetical protein